MEEIVGKIIHGNGLGKKYGMPTANVEVSFIVEEALKNIKYGVYASKVYISNDKNYFDEKIEYIGVTNIGIKPTIDDSGKISIETNIIDFDEDIYDKFVKLKLIKYIRDIKKFNSLEDVKKQVDDDKKVAIEMFKYRRFI